MATWVVMCLTNFQHKTMTFVYRSWQRKIWEYFIYSVSNLMVQYLHFKSHFRMTFISANDIHALYTFQLNLNPQCPNVLTNRYLILKLCMQRTWPWVKTEGARLVRWWWWWWWASRNMKLWVSHPGAKVSTAWPRTGHWMATSLH